MQQRMILGVIGAAAGALVLIQIGDWVRPPPSSQTVASTNAANPSPSEQINEANEVKSPTPSINITSHNQSGGITAHTVNIGPQRLAFSEQTGADLVKAMPIKKKVKIHGIGNETDWQVVLQFHSYLRANGYDAELTSKTGMAIPPPDRKLSVRESEEAYDVTIAPSAAQ